MSGGQIVIQVFHGAEGNCANCSGGCEAMGVGVQATTEHLADIFRERYGDRIKVDYVDIFTVNLNNYPRVIAAIKDGFDMPIIVFNDHPRLSGAINMADIVEVITEMDAD
ncbi:MAG: hypothetical protein ACM3NT_07380 [Methylocystaceae bacterium]